MKQKLIIKANGEKIKVRAKTDGIYVSEILLKVLHCEMRRIARDKDAFDSIKKIMKNTIDRMQCDGTLTEDEC